MKEYIEGREREFKDIIEGYYVYYDMVGWTITGTIYHELEENYKLGQDVSVIALAQVLLEEELFEFLKKNNINPSSKFGTNINLAKRNGLISSQLKDSLNESRLARNKMLHPNLIKDSRTLYNLAKTSLNAVSQLLKTIQ